MLTVELNQENKLPNQPDEPIYRSDSSSFSSFPPDIPVAQSKCYMFPDRSIGIQPISFIGPSNNTPLPNMPNFPPLPPISMSDQYSNPYVPRNATQNFLIKINNNFF